MRGQLKGAGFLSGGAGGGENVLRLIVVMVTQVYECNKNRVL